MLNDDPIVDEIRKVRDQHARRFGYNLKRICADLRKLEKRSARRVVLRHATRQPSAGR